MSCNKPFLKRNADGVCVSLPCGYCAACRRDKLVMWTDRILFEISTSERKVGTFVTLTYEDRFLPRDGVRYDHLHKFLKDFRYAYDKRYGRSLEFDKYGEWHWTSKYKYFFVSEYGELGRPHYHGIITSADCMEITGLVSGVWKKGYVKCLPANASTVRYVLKYMSKQDTREDFFNPVTGEVQNGTFRLMSKGIGRRYMYLHATRLRQDFGYKKGVVVRPLPYYYRKLLNIPRRVIDGSQVYSAVLDYEKGRDLSCYDGVGLDRAAFVRNEVTNFYGDARDIAMKTQEELKVRL